MVPDFLKKGDKVVVTAPAYAMDRDKVLFACDMLRECGLKVEVAKGAFDNSYKDDGRDCYSSDAATRTADLVKAVKDPDCKAIIATRGGYGCIHLISGLSKELISSNPKWIVGYSDLTTLLMVWAASGVAGIHGNMCSALHDDGLKNESNRALIDLLFGKVPSYSFAPNANNICGQASGMLLGGNFITFEALSGGEFGIPEDKDVILFLEDVGEPMHALDRLFNILMMQMGKCRIKGLVFGRFSQCVPDLPYADVEELLVNYTRGLDIPVCYGFPAGHCGTNMPLLMGVGANLEVTAEGSSLTFSI